MKVFGWWLVHWSRYLIWKQKTLSLWYSVQDGVSCDPHNTIQPSQCQYQLMGVVVHKGEIDGGHYYSFIKERPCVEKDDQDCRWWRFDDSSVEEWDINRLDEDCFGGPKIEEDSIDRQRDSTDDMVKSR